MFEVHSGSRPVRPSAAVVASAAALALTLCLAWLQTRQSLALGAPVRIAGTDLVVRPPAGWVQHPNQPGTFLLTRGDRDGQPVGKPERRISFIGGRNHVYFSPADLLTRDQPSPLQPEPATIAGLPGVEVRRLVWREFRGWRYAHETIIRMACSPRGDFVRVDYEPLTEPTQGDLELLRAVSAAVRIDTPGATLSASDALAAAGIQLKTDPKWRFAAADFPDVQGCYLADLDPQQPYGIAILRTWLAPGRSPADLVIDFAAERWERLIDPQQVRQRQRADGAAVAAAEVDDDDAAVFAAQCVAAAPHQAVMLFLAAPPRARPAARAALEQLADNLQFAPTSRDLDLSAALAAGAELAEHVRREGIAGCWTNPQSSAFHLAWSNLSAAPVAGFATARKAVADGFDGVSAFSMHDRIERETWHVARDMVAFSRVIDGTLGDAPAIPIRIEDDRAAGSSRIQRVVTLQRRRDGAPREQKRAITPGNTFISPPSEPIAEARAARTGRSPCVVECLSRYGPATHTRLLRSLPAAPTPARRTDEPAASSPGGRELPRVLVQYDFNPAGTVLAIDEDGELARQEFAGLDVWRADAAALMRHFRKIADLFAD
ncbi:MAG: hypothetical protein CHACPFDD_01063 [Phycisphaerae bacterium]|nr:hypothetical protein [Phycisphaerae bacterium]